MATGRPKGRITNSDVCTAVAKIRAYLRLGNEEKAKKWTMTLLSYLDAMKLLPEDVSRQPSVVAKRKG